MMFTIPLNGARRATEALEKSLLFNKAARDGVQNPVQSPMA